MPRIKLKLMENYPFFIQITVRTTDLNYGGHLGNDRLLALVHEARIAFLAQFGFSELDCGGISLIMGDAAIVFQGEAFAGDVLKVEVAAGEPTRSGFRLFYRITGDQDRRAVALVETGMICYDYSAKKIQPLPDRVKDICLESQDALS
ncbi:MAG: thioesterase family protein [Candidatus Aminicenantes bacterium]|nr:thioesterase family protein [Candidatus Aminicenantes bacterium]